MSWWKSPKAAAPVDEAGKALEAFAATLRALGRHALDTDEMPASKWADQCEGWARRAEALLGTGEAQHRLAKELRSDWGSLTEYIGEQSAAQAGHIRSSLIGLRQVVQACGRSVSEEMLSGRSEMERLETAVSALQAAHSAADQAALNAALAAMAQAVSEVNAARRGREGARLKLIGERVRDIKAELADGQESDSIDSETDLFNTQALLQHLQRVADLGPLFANPPCLILVDLDLPAGRSSSNGHSLLWHVSACVLRTFLRKQDYVARAAERRLAVVLIDTVLPNVDMLCDRLEQSVKDLKGVEGTALVGISIGASAWSLGETPAQWMKRVESMVPQVQARARRRSVKPPPLE